MEKVTPYPSRRNFFPKHNYYLFYCILLPIILLFTIVFYYLFYCLDWPAETHITMQILIKKLLEKIHMYLLRINIKNDQGILIFKLIIKHNFYENIRKRNNVLTPGVAHFNYFSYSNRKRPRATLIQ